MRANQPRFTLNTCPASPRPLSLAISSIVNGDSHSRKHAHSFPVLLALGVLSSFGADLAQAQVICGLTNPVTWTSGASGNWSTGTNWSSNPSIPNGIGTNVCISDGTSSVALNPSVSVASLQLNSGNTLTQNRGSLLSLYGPQIINNGQIVMDGGGGNNTYLLINGDTTLSGTGTLTLNTTTSSGGSALIYNNAGGTKTLTNQSTIQGGGIIGHGTGLAINNSGTINANSMGGPLGTALTFNNVGGLTNTGLMEATNSGVLQLHSQIINNNGGNIKADGASAVVQITNSTVQGGTLNAVNGGTVQSLGSSNLDGSTGSGAVTLNGQYTVTAGSQTTLLGTINNNNNIQVNGGGGNQAYLLLGGNTALQGGGTVTMTTPTAGGGESHFYSNAGAVTLTNINNTIQGSGLLGEGTAMTFINQSGGIVNANSTGGTLNTLLTLNTPNNVVQNAGLLEATNKGVLRINGTVDNSVGTGGNITANGANATVQIYNATILGGTLNAVNGGTMQNVGSSVLNGSSHGALILNGQYTVNSGSQTTLLGTINNNNNIQVNGGGGNQAYLLLGGNTTLQGGGTVTMTTPTTGGGDSHLYSSAGAVTLTNVNNTIQGSGLFGQGTALTFINQAGGVVSANSTGSPLNTVLQVHNAGGSINQGLMEASNSGVLELSAHTINNTGGQIRANNGATVQLDGGVVLQGGTLTNNGGTVQTVGSATLDGRTRGALTLNGQYEGAKGSNTYLLGAINNTGNLQINGGGGNQAYLFINGDTTLQGGGTVTMATPTTGGGDSHLYSSAGAVTLTNVNNTIQGSGLFGQGTALTFINQAGGVVSANSTGSPLNTVLQVHNAGGSINQGLMEASNSGVLELSAHTINNTGGQIRANNGATVQLDGGVVLQGGTLTNNGGTVQTAGSATLDGSTHGPLTLNGQYTGSIGSVTYLLGAINNTGNLQINGGGGNQAYLFLRGDTTLTGGGTVTLNTITAGGGDTHFYTGGVTLTNDNNTIQGSGLFGEGTSMALANSGQITANETGKALTINLTGGFTNTGTLQATNGGILNTTNAFTGTGTARVDGAGKFNVGANSTVGNLINNGTTATALNLGSHNITVSSDYNNANFGIGDMFSRRANVTGTGQILASGDVKQAITGANVSSGGTATPTLTIGNVHVGNNTVLYQIANAGTSGPALRGAIQTTGGGANISDTRLTGAGVTAGNYGPVAAGSSSGSLAVNFNAASAGALAPLTGQAVNIVNNFDNVSSQLLSIQVGATAAAYNLAQGSATPTPVTLANQRVGGTGSQVLTVSNTAPSGIYTEGLDAGFGTNTGSVINNGGAINLLAGGANSTAMAVGVNTASAGAKSGTATLNYVSDGTGISGLGTTNVGSQTINVSGNVYRLAQGSTSTTPISFGKLRVGDLASQALTVQNTATVDGFSEKLNASFGGLTGAATTNGSSIGLLAAGGSNNAMTVGINTSTAGAKSGSVTLNYVSDGNGTSGLSAIAAGNQTVNVIGDVYRLAQGSTTPSPIVFANSHVGDTASQVLTVQNIAATDGYSEKLNASFGGTTGVATHNGGSINLLAAGGSNNSAMSVGLNTSNAGAKSGSVTVNYASDGTGTSGLAAIGAGNRTVIVSGDVYRLASANTLSAVNFGNVHVGDSVQQALSITNTAINDGFSEKLTASFGASSDARITTSGSISQLAAGASNTSSMIVGLNTSAAGSVNGTQVVNFASDGTSTSGLGITALASQTIGVTGDIATSGSVYRLASAGAAMPNPVNFGNVRIGSSADQALSISNTAVNDGFSEKLNASISSNGAPVTASGTFSLLAAQSTDNSSLHVGIDTSSAGAKNGSATIAMVSDGTGTSGLGTTSLAPQTVNVTGAVYRMASPTLGTPSVTIAARVGDSVSANQAVSITNSSPDIYTEGLKVVIGSASGNAQSNGGSIANLAAKGTDSSTIGVGLGSTAVAGVTNGQVNLNLASTGAGTTGATEYSLASQAVNVVGHVYQTAVAAVNTKLVDFGIVHVDDSVAAKNVSVTNNGASADLNDVLKGSISASGPFTATGNLGSGLLAGATDASSLKVGLSTGSAGLLSGTALLALTSHNGEMSDLTLSGNNLTVTLEGQVNNYAKADILKASGAGSLNRSGSMITLNLGTFMQGSGSVLTELEVMNNVTGLSDLLKGSFDLTGANDFIFTGFGAFGPGTTTASLAAGDVLTGLEIAFDTATLGSFTDQIALNGFGYNSSGYTDSQTLTLVLMANVVAGGTVPEPGTLMLLAIALAGMLIQRRRAMLH